MQRVAAPGSGALWPDSVPASGSVPSNRRAPRATEEGTAASGFADRSGPTASAVPSASASIIIIESLGFAKRRPLPDVDGARHARHAAAVECEQHVVARQHGPVIGRNAQLVAACRARE